MYKHSQISPGSLIPRQASRENSPRPGAPFAFLVFAAPGLCAPGLLAPQTTAAGISTTGANPVDMPNSLIMLKNDDPLPEIISRCSPLVPRPNLHFFIFNFFEASLSLQSRCSCYLPCSLLLDVELISPIASESTWIAVTPTRAQFLSCKSS